MKKSLHILLIALTVISFTSCYDRDIVDFKEFDYALPKVENLKYTKQGDAVALTWNIPADISPGFVRPLEVSIQKVENDIYRDVIIVGGEGTSKDIAIEANKSYRFVVKLAGYLKDDAKVKGRPDRVYSEGVILEIQ